MKKVSLVVSLILLAGLFLYPNVSYASLDSTGSVDSITFTPGTFYKMGEGISGNPEQLGWGYKPSASHNICSVTLSLRYSLATSDSVRLDLRSGTTTSNPSVTISEQGDLVQTADQEWQISSSSFAPYEYTFSPCAVTVGGNDYFFVIYRTGSKSTTEYYEVGVDTAPPPDYTGFAAWTTLLMLDTTNALTKSSPGTGYSYEIVINGTENFSAFTASSTTGYSSSTCTPPNSILDVGGGVSYALCYMFVPNQAIIDQFYSIPDTLYGKIPFSYVGEIENAFLNITLNATSSMPLISIPLSTIASSTVTGVIPDLELSTSTIGVYFTDDIRLPLHALLIAAMWLAFAWHVFGRALTIFRA